MPDLREALIAHQFTEGMDPEHVEMMMDCVIGHSTFEEDDVIFRAGSQADRFYLLEDGEVALEVHSPAKPHRIVQTVSGGDILGWSWLFEPYRWSFDARALVPTTAIVLDAEKVRHCADEHADVGVIVIKRIAGLVVRRLQATRLQLLDLYASST